MYKVVKKSRAIQSVIIFMAIFIMITIYPLRLWDETIPSVSRQILAGSSDSVSEDYMLQRFIAQYDHLGTINLYIADFENGWNRDLRVDSFLFRMLDSDMQIMFEEEVDVRFIDIPGFCSVYINEDLEVGRDYYFFLQGIKGSRAWFGLEETASAGTQYVSRLVYNYDELEGYNIIGEYNYTVPLRKNKVFMYDAVLVICAAVLAGAVELYFRMTKRDKFITVERAFRFTANILVAAGTIISIWTIGIRQFFSGQWTDNLFYTVGALLCSISLFYAVNHKKVRADHVPLGKRWKANGQNLLQSVFFAAAMWACCNYINGLYDIHHRVAERQLMIFIALVAIVMCTKKEIWNKVTVIYAAAAAGITIWYRSIYVDYLAMDEWDIKILRLGIMAVILGGFLIVNIIMQLIQRRKMERISVWYGVILAFFFLFIIIFRNTRWWTVAMAAAFSLFYLRYALWDKKTFFLQNICNGLLIHFVCSMIFSFVRRPFLSWVYPRFPFIFHTVTVTAVYMTFILCAAVIKLIDKYRKSRRFKDIWKELLLVGMSGTYMLFTASRTGFLAAAVMIIVILIMLAADAEKAKVKTAAIFMGSMICSVVWCFPIVFTAQRILPAVCNNIFKYEVEVFPDAITRGNEWDSMYYITVERFAEVFNNKIFGLPESGSGSYERSEEYQKYRARRFNSKGEVVWEGSIQEMYEGTLDDGNEHAGSGSDAKEKKLNIIGIKTEEERAAEDTEAAKREQEALAGSHEETEEIEEEEIIEDASVYEKTEEYANGRMDIFRAYIEQLNLTGHDEMGALLPDGSLAVHAHNIYLQVAYDHGLAAGILFVIVGGATFVQGCIYYKKRRKEVPCAGLPAAVVAAFAMAGLVEWIFHLCHPAGFILMTVLAPLLFDMGGKKDKANEER